MRAPAFAGEAASLSVPSGPAGGSEAASLRLEWMQWCPTPDDPERAEWRPLGDGDSFTFYDWYAPTACVRVRGAELPSLSGSVMLSSESGFEVEMQSSVVYVRRSEGSDDAGPYIESPVWFVRTDWMDRFSMLSEGERVTLSWDVTEVRSGGEYGEVVEEGLGSTGGLVLAARLETD